MIRMGGAPGLHSRNMDGVAEVPAVLGFGQPSGLAGGLARSPARGGGAVPLAVAVACIGLEKLPAAQALTLPRPRHGCSSTGSRQAAPQATGHALRAKSEEDGFKVEIHKFRQGQAGVGPVVVAAQPQAVAASAPTSASDNKPASDGKPDYGGLTPIESPMVGTFYRKPDPNSANFVEVGSSVTKGQTVCIVEAMKLFNEIESEIGGTIEKILVEDGESVDFGQALMLIRQ